MIKKILLWLKTAIFAIFVIAPVLINTSARSNSQQNLVQSLGVGSIGVGSSSKETTSTIPKVGFWNLAFGTNITDGGGGTIFQAQNGDLYAMGFGTGLQILKGGKLTPGNQFEKAPGTTIIKGQYGTIFQASNGDLYAMGWDTGLQVLKGGGLTPGNQFITALGTTITKGQHGTIFQAQNGDLYAMGFGTGLQVLKGGELTGEKKFEKALGTNITDGDGGTIFQAQNDDLYAMGYNTGLQVLKGGKLTPGNQFEKAPGTDIFDGNGATIFQAKNGDLYTMGLAAELQVLKGGTLTSRNQFEKAPGSVIFDGVGGTIFQAQNDDLYAMGPFLELEVLKGGKLTGKNEFKIAPGTDITDGDGGTIFQAKNGDLYAMGNGTRLEVLKGGTLTPGKKFEIAPGTNIIDGNGGTIFQARNGDLYAMGNGTGLEVLKGGTLTSRNQFVPVLGTNIIDGNGGTIFQTKNDDLYAMGNGTGLEILLKFIKTNETEENANDGTIIVTNFDNDSSKLQYKTLEEEIWTDLLSTGIIQRLSPGKYQFQWKSKSGKHYVGTTSETQTILGFQEILAWKNIQELVDIAVAKFEARTDDGLKASQTNDNSLVPNVITGKEFSLPSELVGTITADNLGFTEPSPLTGVIVTYSISSHDDATGMIVVQVIITSSIDPTISTTVYFKLSGYQTTAAWKTIQDNQQAIDNLATKFETKLKGVAIGVPTESTETTLRAKATTLPSTLIVDPSPSSLGFIAPTAADVNVAYEATSDDATGTMIVTATISKGDATNIVKFKLSGFLTSDQQVVNGGAANFKEAASKLYAKDSDVSLIATSTNLTDATSTLPSELLLLSEATHTTLGFNEPFMAGGVNLVCVIQSHSDATGTLIVKATISKGEATNKVVYFKLSGYQTTAERTIQDNQKAVDAVASWFKETGEGKFHAKDDEGDIDTPTSVTGKSDVLPSEISTPSAPNLGIENLIGTNADNVDVVYTVSESGTNDNDGILIVKATISKESAFPQVVYFKLDGYQATAERTIQDNQEIVDSLATKFVEDLKAVTSGNPTESTESTLEAKATKLPSTLTTNPSPSSLGFIAPIATDVNVAYKATSDDAAGTMIVTATISKGDATNKIVKFKLSGFLTSEQQVVNGVATKFKEAALGKLYAKDSDVSLTATSTGLTEATSILPSQLLSANSPETFGFTEPSITGDVNVVYVIQSHSDAAGTLTIKATISKGEATNKVVYFKLSGYQSTAERTTQNDQKAVNDAANWFKGTEEDKLHAKDVKENIETSTSVTGKSDVLPSEISTPSASDLGIQNLIGSSVDNVNVVYAMNSYSDNYGTLIVTATISKGTASPKVVYFKLSGYQTTTQRSAQAAINDAMKVINDANGNYDGTNLAVVTDWTTFTSGTYGIDISTILSGVTVEYHHPIVAKDKSFTISFKVTKGSKSKEFTKEINVVAKNSNDANGSDENNNAVILGTTIPIGIIFLAGMAYLIFKKMKKRNNH